MISKILLLARTVRYLKPVQITHQLYNRVRPVRNLGWYINKNGTCPGYTPLNFTLNYTTEGLVEGEVFNFLNIRHSFVNGVDWDYQEYGKLWNYNLQYFGFLHQPDIPNDKKEQLLEDIGAWLINGKLKLEPYPVSLRVINTIRFISSCKTVKKEIVTQLYAQLAFLNTNLEYHILGNHLLENAFALFMGAHFFNEDNWKKKAEAILYKELKEQTLNDGAHFELSPMYHQIILFRVLELGDWYAKVDNADAAFLKFIHQKAAEMLTWLQAVSFKNGDIPHFNDSAAGITFTTGQLQAFAKQLNIQPYPSAKLQASGYRQYSSANYECVVDVGPVGPSYQPGHSHADVLSFVLYHNNRPLIVDVGTSTYQIGDRRTYERSTAAHNTVVINGQNQSEVWGGFRVGRRAEVSIIADAISSLTASHNGYKKTLSSIHQRSFIFADNIINIEDIIVGNNNNLVCIALFHFHPQCSVQINNNNKVSVSDMATITFAGTVKLHTEQYEFADGFNKYLPATCLVATFTNELKSAIELL